MKNQIEGHVHMIRYDIPSCFKFPRALSRAEYPRIAMASSDLHLFPPLPQISDLSSENPGGVAVAIRYRPRVSLSGAYDPSWEKHVRLIAPTLILCSRPFGI
jgi:hypothetical protein